jgi:hypothetical protein
MLQKLEKQKVESDKTLQKAEKGRNCGTVYRKNLRYILFTVRKSHGLFSLISSTMEPEDVSFVKNQRGGDHVKDKDGYVYRRSKSLPLKDQNYRNCVFCLKFSCPVTVVSSISSQKLISRSGEHRHSNQLIERKVKDIDDEKIKMAAQNPSVSPGTVLGDISATLDNQLAGGTSYMRSKHPSMWPSTGSSSWPKDMSASQRIMRTWPTFPSI